MVQLHEMILRDAHQSMLATRMRTEDMLPISEKLDQVGFFAMEVWGGATFDVAIRYLNQDPWERIRELKEAMPNTPMQMLERAMNIVAYRNFPDDVVKKFINEDSEMKTEVEPVAFGLNALKIIFVMDESIGSPDPLEESIEKL